MARHLARLVVSFVGKTDLDFLRPQGDDLSPVRRLLRGLSTLQPHIPPARTRLLLLDDDRAGRNDRARFCEALRGQLPGLGLEGLVLERRPVALPEGPTDLNALYENVWAAIPTSGPEQADEIVFHLTSGTPAMQFTLMLAANCLRLDKARLIETSREHDVREVRLPYVLAARERRLGERAHPKSGFPEKSRHTLLPDTVLDDPAVQAAYAALYKAATNRRLPQRLVVQGPAGSGKWRACRQFARWRRGEVAAWLDPASRPELPGGATLLIHRLDAWPQAELQRLALLAAERPDCAIAATFRTDRVPVVPLAVLARDGLRGAAHIELPALGSRSDVVALGEALARQLGVLGGKVKERLQYELLTDLYPHNLHDLKSLLATAATRSPGAHPERAAYVQARQIRDARAMLAEACQILTGMDFGPNRHRLDDVLDVIRAVIVRRARADGRSQDEVGELLGISQQTVSTILKSPLDLRGWRTAPEELDEPD